MKEYHYIACFILKVDGEDIEILETNVTPLKGGMDSESYYLECAANIDLDKIYPEEETESGIYRIVAGAICEGWKYETDWGTEYDADEDYEVLSQYKYSDDEGDFILNHNRDVILES